MLTGTEILIKRLKRLPNREKKIILLDTLMMPYNLTTFYSSSLYVLDLLYHCSSSKVVQLLLSIFVLALLGKRHLISSIN